MRNFIWLKSLLVIFLLSVSLFAQTSSELRKKYQVSNAIETFEVRPNVMATFFYGEGGQAIAIFIRPRPTSDTNNQSKTEMPDKIAEEVLDELVPVSVRGKSRAGQSIDFVSGRNIYQTMSYENLTVDKTMHQSTIDKLTVSQIYIVWQKTLGR